VKTVTKHVTDSLFTGNKRQLTFAFKQLMCLIH